MLSGIYLFVGALLVIATGLALVAAMRQNSMHEMMSGFAVTAACAVAAIVNFGLGEAARVLLVIEERTRKP
jgi:putative copper export protein